MKSEAVFLDRDGTINIDVHYLDDPDKFERYLGVPTGVKNFGRTGLKLL